MNLSLTQSVEKVLFLRYLTLEEVEGVAWASEKGVGGASWDLATTSHVQGVQRDTLLLKHNLLGYQCLQRDFISQER